MRRGSQMWVRTTLASQMGWDLLPPRCEISAPSPGPVDQEEVAERLQGLIHGWTRVLTGSRPLAVDLPLKALTQAPQHTPLPQCLLRGERGGPWVGVGTEMPCAPVWHLCVLAAGWLAWVPARLQASCVCGRRSHVCEPLLQCPARRSALNHSLGQLLPRGAKAVRPERPAEPLAFSLRTEA